MKKLIAVLLTTCVSLYATAQQAAECPQQQQPEMANLMRSNGKIYVVVTCLVIVFSCIVAYIITMDRRLTKLEKEASLAL